jgi:membrane glycosyltransferase
MDSTISVAKAQHTKRNQLQMLSDSRRSDLAIAEYRRNDQPQQGCAVQDRGG